MEKNKKMISFKRLAEISGVSVGTLSRYFNNGPISEKNKETIRKNIFKYGFIRNNAASLIRKKNNTTIIIRTFIYSSAQDIIIEGIIHSLVDKDIIIRYSKKDEKSVNAEIDWAIEQRPKNMIIFSPINQSNKIIEKINRIKNFTNISFYDFKNDFVPNVSVSYNNAFKNISKKISEITFVHSDDNDRNSFLNRVKNLKKFLNVNLISDLKILDKNKYYLFQTEKLRMESISNIMKSNQKIKNISISYYKPLFLGENDLWIFVDYYRIGVEIVNMLLKGLNDNVEINAELIENNIF